MTITTGMASDILLIILTFQSMFSIFIFYDIIFIDEAFDAYIPIQCVYAEILEQPVLKVL